MVDGFVPVCNACDVVDSVVAEGDASKHGLCGAESTSGGSAAMLAQRSPVRGLMGLSSGREAVSDFSAQSTPTFLRSRPRGGAPSDEEMESTVSSEESEARGEEERRERALQAIRAEVRCPLAGFVCHQDFVAWGDHPAACFAESLRM